MKLSETVIGKCDLNQVEVIRAKVQFRMRRLRRFVEGQYFHRTCSGPLVA